MKDTVTEYAKAVDNDEISACLYVKQACRRHLHDLEAGEFIFDKKAARLAIGFSKILRHYKGEFAGHRFNPEPWQQFIKGSIFGWKHKDGRRRFRFAYVEVPRKNGKTFMAADVALQGLVADFEPAADIYSVATKRDQAKIVWTDAKHMAKRCPSLAAKITSLTTGLYVDATASKFEPLSKDTKSMDGLNPHFAIGDEVHAWEDDNLFRQMEEGMGARRQPLFLLITTAGHNIDGVCYRLRDHVISVLDGFADGNYIDDHFFGIIYTLDEGDDWKDENTWPKANPNLGVSKRLEILRSQVKFALQVPSEEFTVKRKQFNIWTAGKSKWLDMERWLKCDGEIDLELLKREPCHLGIDLSSIQDLTATVALFPPGVYSEWTVVPRLYLPEDRLDFREKVDKRPYKLWEKQGYLLTTPGDVIDLNFIKRDILDLADTYNVIDAGFDPWKAIEMATSLGAEGVEMVQMRQGHATLGAPSLYLEKLVLGKQLRHAGHPVLRWMAGNTAVIRDVNDNIRPDKSATRARIDGIVALVMALGRAIVHMDEPPPEIHIIENQ